MNSNRSKRKIVMEQIQNSQLSKKEQYLSLFISFFLTFIIISAPILLLINLFLFVEFVPILVFGIGSCLFLAWFLFERFQFQIWTAYHPELKEVQYRLIIIHHAKIVLVTLFIMYLIFYIIYKGVNI